MTSVRPVSWERWFRWFGATWRQGEHVAMVGPTGSGKTTLELALLGRRRYVVVLGTKPKDDNLSRLTRAGWKRIGSWAERPAQRFGADYQRLVLWPKYRRLGDQEAHPAIFREALGEMFAEGNWTVAADEAHWLSKRMGLDPEMREYWQQGRSLGLTFVAATQRPVWVPVEMWSSSTHLFLWKTNEHRDIDKLAGLGAFAASDIRRAVEKLERYQTLYVNTRDGQLMSFYPPPPAKLRIPRRGDLMEL